MNTDFWHIPPEYRTRVALIDADTGSAVTYADLDRSVDALAASAMRGEKQLIFLFCSNKPTDVVAYLAALRAGHAVLLLESKLEPKLRQDLIGKYQPDTIVESAGNETHPDGYREVFSDNRLNVYRAGQPYCGPEPHQELGLLLSTSGTTGSPKLVRLAYRSVQANSVSIAQYLSLDGSDRAITSLPMSYSYGLSVINSHLLRGASVVCTSETMAQRPFWDVFRQYSCTSFAGVPYNYQLLMRLGFANMSLPSLRAMTQAGGRLNERFKRYFAENATSRGVRFFVMYGQTEATARISYLPPEQLANKLESIGIAIPGGRLSLRGDSSTGAAALAESELVYEGPNVMLGYAESRACLAKGDELNGVLSTGDVAYRDSDGYYFITGRLKRFLKVFGLRLNLDEIEKALENEFSCVVACTGSDDKLVVIIEHAQQALANPLRARVVEIYKIHVSAVTVKLAPAIPVTAAGKKDYAKINELAP